MDAIKQYKNKLKDLLTEDRISQVLICLKSHINTQTTLYDEFISLASQFHRLEKEKRIGTYSLSEIRQVESQILQSLLSLINAIQKEDLENFQMNHEKMAIYQQRMDEYEYRLRILEKKWENWLNVVHKASCN